MVLEVLYIVLILLRISFPTLGARLKAQDLLRCPTLYTRSRLELDGLPYCGKLHHGHLDQLAAHVIAARALSSLLCHSSSAVAPALSHRQLKCS